MDSYLGILPHEKEEKQEGPTPRQITHPYIFVTLYLCYLIIAKLVFFIVYNVLETKMYIGMGYLSWCRSFSLLDAHTLKTLY